MGSGFQNAEVLAAEGRSFANVARNLEVSGRSDDARINYLKASEKLYANDQLVFRYCDEKGTYAGGKYPINPNGAFHDIAGICDPSGTILGLMPHPERAYYGVQLPHWTTMKEIPKYGDGRLILESMVEYLEKR